jgi:hypothetical protein
METHAATSASATDSGETPSKTPQKPADILAVGEAEISHQPRILSLDGGGVRGLSSLVVLREIMEEVQRQAKLKEIPRPCDYFDLIGGTSTGGLIAIMLGRLKMVEFQVSQGSNGKVNRRVHQQLYEVKRGSLQS